jgi:hypothetical protein
VIASAPFEARAKRERNRAAVVGRGSRKNQLAMNNTKLLENHKSGYAFFFAVAVVAPLAWGCASTEAPDIDEDEEIGEVQQRDLTQNDLTQNAMAPIELSANAAAMQQLSAGAISNSAMSNNDLSDDGYGLQLMKYMVRCALPEDVCMDVQSSANDANVPLDCVAGRCHLCGNLNLAPNWLNGGLSQADERWVSACLLAHVNTKNVSVLISARDAVSGRIPSAPVSETDQFDGSEAAFYGNLFRPGPGGVFEKYVCNAGASQVPTGRVCGLDAANADQCRMTFMGSCAGGSISAGGPFNPNAAACSYVESSDNGAVRQCLDAQGGRWDEVITIYNQ